MTFPSETRQELGGRERRVARPQSEAELRALFADLKEARQLAILFGRGSSMDWCAPSLWHAPLQAGDGSNDPLWISMESLVAPGATGIVEYVPGDGTLTAQGGAHIETLRAAVLEGGHRITPAGPRTGSTLGGLLASGASSIDRCGFGPTRHHVLGMRIQDAAGRGPTKTGGRLVKNVTGFDLHRLHVGGRGTLGAILEASLRLVPVPEAEALLVSRPYTSAAAAASAALIVRSKAGIHPRALFIARNVVYVWLAGRERQVDVEVALAEADLDVANTERGPQVEPQALEAARRVSLIMMATAPSQVSGVVQHLDAMGIGPLYIEPDAALVEIDGEALANASLDVPALLSGLAPRRVHVTLRRPTTALQDLRVALQDRHSIPAAARLWTERLLTSFDPSGILASDDFPLQAAPTR